MNTKFAILFMSLAVSQTLSAQVAQKGGISEKMLQQMRAEVPQSTTHTALVNAVTANSIDKLAKNYKNSGKIDTYFNVETAKQNIQNQHSSGRCWMFSGLNVLRSDFAQEVHQAEKIEFSHAYLFFYDQLEKSNLMLQATIDNANKPIDDIRVQFFFRNPINDGGTFVGVADLVDKYGVVPMSVMPETYSTDNTSKIKSLISSKLREFGLELRQMVQDKKSTSDIQKRKTEMLGTIYQMLSLAMGEPVKEFTYTFKDTNGKPMGEARKYTPQEFYKATLGKPLAGTFIMVMNDPRRPYYKTFEVEYDRHTYDGSNWKYINLPMEEIAKMAIASLKDGHKLYSSYDVGKQLDKQRGYLAVDNYDYGALFGTTFGMNKAQRIETFDSGSTHAMTLTAVDLDSNGNPLKWKVENSWGAEYGQKGYLIMTNQWFNEYMFRLVVDKKYVPQSILKAYEAKPTLVTPEDPLFLPDDM